MAQSALFWILGLIPIVILRRELASVENAQWSEGDDQELCHPGTRVELLKRLQDWSTNPNSKRVFWLHGLAGTGKSTISRTFCETIYTDGWLAGSFFVSRGVDKHRDARAIARLLAYGLALCDFDVRSSVLDVLKTDPNVLTAPLPTQIKKLIEQPLTKASSRPAPLILVIDAFDECDLETRNAEATKLIPLFAHALKTPDCIVKLLITSRADPRLQKAFQGISILHQSLSLHSADHIVSNVTSDIRNYLQVALAEVAEEREILHHWPNPETISKLVVRSGELFVFASTLVKFLRNSFEDPTSLLDDFLSVNTRTNNSSEPYHELDTLYTSILIGCLRVHGRLSSHNCTLFRSLVGTIVILLEPLSTDALSRLLGAD